MEESVSFIRDVRNILYKTSLDENNRLNLIRNMVLFILGIEINMDEYKNKRKDSIVREQAKDCDIAFKRADQWIYKANLSRYYLSFLRRGLINFLQTGDLNYSALNFRCSEADLCLCYDVLKERGSIETVRARILNEEVSPVFLSEKSMQYIMKQIEYTIKSNLDKVKFLTDNGVEERSFIETELKIWAYRVMYLKDGVIDLVYLVNYLKNAISNHCSNIRASYTTEKRNTGLIKTSDDSGALAEYSKVVVPLDNELSDFLVSKDKIKKDDVPEFISKVNFGESEKKKLNKFFLIVGGQSDEEFERWIEMNKYNVELSNLQGNAYIDRLSELAIDFIGMGYLMQRIRDSWEVFNDCKNLPSKRYRYLQSLHDILSMQIPIKIKCRVLVTRLKYYPDDFVSFLKSNRMNLDELSDDKIEKMADIYYGSIGQKDMPLYRAALSRIKLKVNEPIEITNLDLMNFKG